MTEQQKQFLKTVTGPAFEAERVYGIPGAVTVAQAILESAGRVNGHWEWGASPLFVHANNPFGIKYSDQSPDAKYGAYSIRTHEFIKGLEEVVQAGFQRFPSLEEAFTAHALLLRHPHYAKAWKHRGDARMYAMCLGPCSESNPDGCGYATDPKYGEKLLGLMDRYDLDNAETLYG